MQNTCLLLYVKFFVFRMYIFVLFFIKIESTIKRGLYNHYQIFSQYIVNTYIQYSIIGNVNSIYMNQLVQL